VHSQSGLRVHLVASAVDTVQHNLCDGMSMNPPLSQTTGGVTKHSQGTVIVNINIAR
jgi:hypothetical protein